MQKRLRSAAFSVRQHLDRGSFAADLSRGKKPGAQGFGRGTKVSDLERQDQRVARRKGWWCFDLRRAGACRRRGLGAQCALGSGQGEQDQAQPSPMASAMPLASRMTHIHDPPATTAKGTLYVLATPLGNLRDITRRALDTLAAVDRIAAEDTRDTSRLLAHFGLRTPCFALHQHNERTASTKLIEHLAAGESVALVTDAGTPALSDPGGRVVAAVRAAGFHVTPVPGPSALAAAWSVAGQGETGFVFGGFMPTKTAARRQRIGELDRLGLPLVLYEAPHRIAACLADLATVLGAERPVVITRELTKLFEQVHRCKLGEAVAWLEADANRQRGEFVLVVEARMEAQAETLDAGAEEVLRLLLDELPPTRAAKIAAKITGAPRQALYDRALAIESKSPKKKGGIEPPSKEEA